jgi:hypothetical protein
MHNIEKFVNHLYSFHQFNPIDDLEIEFVFDNDNIGVVKRKESFDVAFANDLLYFLRNKKFPDQVLEYHSSNISNLEIEELSKGLEFLNPDIYLNDKFNTLNYITLKFIYYDGVEISFVINATNLFNYFQCSMDIITLKFYNWFEKCKEVLEKTILTHFE